MAIVNDKLTELGEFLLSIADQASTTRFYPFPKAFRKQRGKESPLGANFESYTEEEYKSMRQTLDKIIKNKDNLPAMYDDDLCLALIEYLFSTELQLYHIGKTFHKSIDEYSFKHNEIKERINDIHVKERWYLFHGSTYGNWHSILRNGLVVASNTDLMSAGASYGVGIYASDDINVSFNYGMSSNNHHYIGILELTTDPAKFKKGVGVYVINDTSCITLRYMLDITKFVPQLNEILPFYKRTNDRMLKQKKVPKRLEKDLDEIKEYISPDRHVSPDRHAGNIDNNHITINYKDVEFKLILESYPFKAPLLMHKGEYIKSNLLSDWSAMNTLKDVIKVLDTLDMRKYRNIIN